MIAVYNIIAAIWSFLTIAAGARYADGALTGPLNFWGEWFDSAFGLIGCKKIPQRDQNANRLKAPCWSCPSDVGVYYPHADNPFFVTQPVSATNCTPVANAGGMTQSMIAGHGGGIMNPVQYINTIFTGSSTGDLNSGQFDKSRFKQGTPYIPLQDTTGDSIGYYYTNDTMGREIPLVAPCTTSSGSTQLRPTNLSNFTGGSTNQWPVGWNAYLTSNALPNQSQQMACNMGTSARTSSTGGYQYVYNNPGTVFGGWSNTLGFPTDNTSITPTNPNDNYNSIYVSSVLQNPNKIKYKQFNRTTPSAAATPKNWGRDK